MLVDMLGLGMGSSSKVLEKEGAEDKRWCIGWMETSREQRHLGRREGLDESKGWLIVAESSWMCWFGVGYIAILMLRWCIGLMVMWCIGSAAD